MMLFVAVTTVGKLLAYESRQPAIAAGGCRPVNRPVGRRKGPTTDEDTPDRAGILLARLIVVGCEFLRDYPETTTAEMQESLRELRPWFRREDD